MKRTTKYAVVFLVAAVIFSVLCSAGVMIAVNTIRYDANKKTEAIVYAVRQKYPDISEIEIAEILNNNTADYDTDKFLEQYGIDINNEWIASDCRNGAYAAIIASAVICFCGGIGLLVIFIIYNRGTRREIDSITDYIKEINDRNYDLHIDENSEDETSLLKNEIYKTTVMLKEQSEQSLKDKQSLKDSLSDISHQLKTPLTSIIVMIDNIIENDDMPQELKKEFLTDIKRSSANISFLLQSLLTLSKFDANSIQLKSNKENIAAIFSEAVHNTSILSELREVSVLSAIDEDIFMECDFKWLTEAITNIVKNCIEHTPPGGHVILNAEQNRLYTKITITDNGHGIDKKDLPHIFERFYKGKNSSEDSVGIGLALAKTIIEKNNGSITASSREEKGTQFTIRYYKCQ